MTRFNHQCAIAFTVISENQEGQDITPAMLRTALQERIDDLDRAGHDEWLEAVGIEDTCPEKD